MKDKTYSEKISWIKTYLGSLKISRDGKNAAITCPACGKQSKFSVNLSNWMCHCWVCGVKSKNIGSLLKKHKSKEVSQSFYSTFGGPESISCKEEDVKMLVKPESLILLASYSGRDPDIMRVKKYCKQRGLTERDFWFFKICASKDYSLSRRVIFPSFDKSGKMNYYVSRTVDATGFPKYKNATVKKTEIIFNEINLRWDREITIVEGAFDLVKAGSNSTCLLGSKLSKNGALFRKIVENQCDVLLALDSDMREESQNIARDLSQFGIACRIANITSGKDVGDMSREEFKKIKKESHTWSPEMHMRFKINSIKSGSLF